VSGKPKNEFAFPQLEAERLKWWGHGMTLRDYFAAKAMQGFCNSRSHVELKGHAIASAKVAYELADAMLKAREA
jgi:hypothetical protein